MNFRENPLKLVHRGMFYLLFPDFRACRSLKEREKNRLAWIGRLEGTFGVWSGGIGPFGVCLSWCVAWVLGDAIVGLGFFFGDCLRPLQWRRRASDCQILLSRSSSVPWARPTSWTRAETLELNELEIPTVTEVKLIGRRKLEEAGQGKTRKTNRLELHWL